MQTQLNHEQTQFDKHTFPITLICDDVYFQDNIGSIFRISEALGVEKILFFGNITQFNYRKINKTSRNTHRLITHEVFQNKKTILNYLKSDNFNIIALEITNKSKNIKEVEMSKKDKIVLIIGNEINGISDDFLNIANQAVHISMHGKNSSMNVVQATSIALFEITNRFYGYSKF